MKALVITVEYPFPPRSGVTIPVANYVHLLQREGFAVDLVIVGGEPAPDRNPAGRVLFLDKKRARVGALARELLLRSPYCCNFEVEPANWKETWLQPPYDLVLCSPLSMVPLGETVATAQAARSPRPRLVAAISDCYTAELRNTSWVRFPGGIKLPRIDHLRGLYMGAVESRVLRSADAVLVQSGSDRRFLEQCGGPEFAAKVRVVSNGVDASLFALPSRAEEAVRRFGFVANFGSPDYRAKLAWFHREVWAPGRPTGCKLVVRGRGLRDRRSEFEFIFRDDTVEYDDAFYAEVGDIYRDIDAVVAPIFRPHGFINKVGEGLAAGLVVIGDTTAFQALPDCRDGVHGLVANSVREFREAMARVAGDAALVQQLRRNARDYADAHLRWENRGPLLMK